MAAPSRSDRSAYGGAARAMDRKTYLRLLRDARRRTRRLGEEEDLLQTALLAAVEAQRADMSCGENRRWLSGVLRNRALHEARTAGRRRRREADYASGIGAKGETPAGYPDEFIATLPQALRTTALLVVTGHTKPEIAWLLGVSDAAMRKRVSEIRRRCIQSGLRGGAAERTLQGDLPFGLLRRALIGAVRSADVAIGTHDPDGHLFVVSSQTGDARQLRTSSI